MNTTKKSLATATIAATALAGLTLAVAPSANAQALATKNFSKSFQQVCQTVGPFGQQTLGAKVTGTVPTTVKKGSSFQVTKGTVTSTVPGNLNSLAYASGARYQKVTFMTVNLDNTNATPKIYNTVKSAITTGFVAVPNGAASTFKISVPTGTLKAGSTGVVTLKSGAVKATFQLYDASKKALGGSQPVGCAAQNVPLTTIKITP